MTGACRDLVPTDGSRSGAPAAAARHPDRSRTPHAEALPLSVVRTTEIPVNLPTNILRSFVAIVDAGSMLQAADRVFVTQSALSLQIRKLEDILQQGLFVRDGRRLSLSPAGDMLLDYARRILSLHDEAVAAIGSGQVSGPVRIGMVQDFAEALLSGVLARFAGLHPDAQIHARVAGTAELLGLLDRGQLDVVVGYAAADEDDAITVAPMAWYGAEALARRGPVLLAVLETPCRFREAAIAALEAEGRPWRIAIETPNLSALRAAVEAGLGLTCRTSLFLGHAAALSAGLLPPLPQIASILRSGDTGGEAVRRLLGLTRDVIAGMQPDATNERHEIQDATS